MTTYYPDQSDPWNNRQFSRRWNEPDHLTTPAAIDRQADFLMGIGRVADAERLSHRAEAMRQGANQ